MSMEYQTILKYFNQHHQPMKHHYMQEIHHGLRIHVVCHSYQINSNSILKKSKHTLYRHNHRQQYRLNNHIYILDVLDVLRKQLREHALLGTIYALNWNCIVEYTVQLDHWDGQIGEITYGHIRICWIQIRNKDWQCVAQIEYAKSIITFTVIQCLMSFSSLILTLPMTSVEVSPIKTPSPQMTRLTM